MLKCQTFTDFFWHFWICNACAVLFRHFFMSSTCTVLFWHFWISNKCTVLFWHFRYHLRIISQSINAPATMGGEEDASSDLPYRYSQSYIIFWSFTSFLYNPCFGKREERKITQNVFQSPIGLYELGKFCCGLLLSFPKCE